MLFKEALIDLNNIQDNMVLRATNSSKSNSTTTWFKLTTYVVLCMINDVTSTPPADDPPSVLVPTPEVLKGFMYIIS